MTSRAWVAGAAFAVPAALVLAFFTRGSDPRILWWQGRAVSWGGRHRGVVWAPEGELLSFGPGLRVTRLPVAIAGRTIVEAAASGRGDVLLVDGGGTVVRRREAGDVI
ncbi:MAG: hypothetical protein Q8Q85_03035, partial [Gemmatimonadales bacterium]|nr:hypothetical protein [Gemmatimonadales bacterium]